jgi:hypothetical protein
MTGQRAVTPRPRVGGAGGHCPVLADQGGAGRLSDLRSSAGSCSAGRASGPAPRTNHSARCSAVPTSFTIERGQHAAENGHAGLARRTVLGRVEWVAQSRQLIPRPEAGAPRPDHASLRLRNASRAAGRIAAVATRSAIARPVASHTAYSTIPVAADGEWRDPSSLVGSTALRCGADHIPTGLVGATDLSRHIDCSETVAAGSGATSRDAIRRAVTTWEVCGKDARPFPAGPGRLSRQIAKYAVRCA